MDGQKHGVPALISFFIPGLGQVIKGQILTFLILLLFFPSVIGQQSKVDSLEKVLKTAKEDTSKVKTIYLLATKFENKEPEKAIEYANKGLELATKLNFKKGISSCLNSLGNANQNLGKNEKALSYYEDRYKIVTEINDSMGIASVYDNMGIVYMVMGENQKCLDYRNKAIDIYKKLNKEQSIANGLLWIGNVYKDMGDYPNALDNYIQALKIYEKYNDTLNCGMAFVNISSIYRYNKQYDKARKYVKDAKTKFMLADYPIGVGMSLYRLALIFNEENKRDSSTKYLLEAKKIFEQVKDENNIAFVNNAIGDNYRHCDSLNIALRYYNEALIAAKSTVNKGLLATIIGNIGIIYETENQYSRALKYLKDAEKLLRELNDKENLKNISYHLTGTYINLKSEKAMDYFQLYQQLSDTLYSQKNANAIAEMQTKYDSEKKEQENALLNIKYKIKEQEAIMQRNYTYIAIAFGIILLLIGIISFNYIRIRNKAAQLSQRHQIRETIAKDLHDDISSGLTSIAMICEKGKIDTKDKNETILYERIRIQSSNLSKKLRELVWANDPESDDLLSLCAYIRNFGTTFFENSSIKYSHKLPDNIPDIKLNPNVKRNLFLVLKEALHNSVRHSGAVSVEVVFQLNDNKGYILEIADNGKGIDLKSDFEFKNGMKNMRKRIEDIKGKFEVVSEQGEGTRIKASGNLV